MFGIIDNPTSGKGRSDALIEKVTAMISERGAEWRMFETECVNDGARQAQLAIDAGCDSIVCIGGDGTLSEVVSVLAGKDVTLYIVPHGTGNDFARAYHVTGDPAQAFAAQLDGEPQRIDLGSVNGKPFLNVSGTGFDVDVLKKTEELKSVYPGGKAYRKAVLSVLSQYQPKEIEIAIDGGAPQHKRVTIVEVANGQYFGGGMQVAPGARYDDAVFDVVEIKPVKSWMIPFLLPLFILGIHVYIPIVKVTKAKRLTITAENMTINIDGRLEEMKRAEYEILPGALRVMKPKK